jgi:DNA-binding response OmpR family regulator
MANNKILLIDDDLEDAELFMEAVLLEHPDTICNIATNPLVAFEDLMVSEDLPDWIFVDFNMPAINGAELIHKMKSETRLAHISFVLMSSHSYEVIASLTSKYEKVKYIVKPSSFPEMVALVGSVL